MVEATATVEQVGSNYHVTVLLSVDISQQLKISGLGDEHDSHSPGAGGNLPWKASEAAAISGALFALRKVFGTSQPARSLAIKQISGYLPDGDMNPCAVASAIACVHACGQADKVNIDLPPGWRIAHCSIRTTQ